MAPQTSNHSNILETNALCLSIAGRLICTNLNVQLAKGHCLGILGQNGTGKTTLLHTLMNFRAPDSGTITLCGKPLSSWSQPQLSQRLGILFQNTHDIMPASVMETALIGRHPHLANWQWEKREDIELAKHALAQVGIADLAQRDISTLSGGERQRLAIATLLTQAPHLFLLDEPGNHLDIAFQVRSLNLLRSHINEHQCALVMATHDINLAARHCEQIILLYGEGNFAIGSSTEVLTAHNLSRAYDCEIKEFEIEQGRRVFFPV